MKLRWRECVYSVCLDIKKITQWFKFGPQKLHIASLSWITTKRVLLQMWSRCETLWGDFNVLCRVSIFPWSPWKFNNVSGRFKFSYFRPMNVYILKIPARGTFHNKSRYTVIIRSLLLLLPLQLCVKRRYVHVSGAAIVGEHWHIVYRQEPNRVHPSLAPSEPSYLSDIVNPSAAGLDLAGWLFLACRCCCPSLSSRRVGDGVLSLLFHPQNPSDVLFFFPPNFWLWISFCELSEGLPHKIYPIFFSQLITHKPAEDLFNLSLVAGIRAEAVTHKAAIFVIISIKMNRMNELWVVRECVIAVFE